MGLFSGIKSSGVVQPVSQPQVRPMGLLFNPDGSYPTDKAMPLTGVLQPQQKQPTDINKFREIFSKNPKIVESLKILQKRKRMARGGRVRYADGSQPQITQQQIAMIVTMLKKGADMSTISSVVGISPEQIQMIVSKIQQGIQQKAPGGIAGFKRGGRIGYANGTQNMESLEPLSDENYQMSPGWQNENKLALMKNSPITELIKLYQKQKEEEYKQQKEEEYIKKMLEEYQKNINKSELMKPTPFNINQPSQLAKGGIPEIDYRDKGGFVPPIGKKERADDIPAMLSNNEFVFTANAVRNAGGGSVKEGAKKMYDLMKKLEGK